MNDSYRYILNIVSGYYMSNSKKTMNPIKTAIIFIVL
jgi:hypothetical protein